MPDTRRQVPIVLGSGSPRRRALLQLVVPEFSVLTADVDETPRLGESPAALANRLAMAKAVAVAALRPDSVVLGADTVVAVRESEEAGISPRWRVLGKPADADEARAFLRLLGGRRHLVITAVGVALPGGGTLADATCSAVWLRDLSASEISDYVASGTTMDKAGGYAIQDDGFRPVARIEGSETNVMGLPVARTRLLLESAGVCVVRVSGGAA